MAQNSTIEERVSLLEEQVVDLEEDITFIQGDVADLDQDVNFLFDEQVIQDERLFSLEQATDVINAELVTVDDELDSEDIQVPRNDSDIWRQGFLCFYVAITDLQDTTLALDFRVTVLEENGGSDGNSSVADLEVRVETLEETAADHETRLTTAEMNIEGLMKG